MEGKTNKKRIKKTIRVLWKGFFDKMFENYTGACAAQAAFFIMLSTVPLVTLFLAVTTYMPVSREEVFQLLMSVIPNDLAGYVKDIITDLYERAGTVVISLSAVILLWSSSTGVAAIMDGFNSMYKIRQENRYWKYRPIAILYTIIFILFFAMVLSVYFVVSHYYQGYIKDVFEMGSKLRHVFLFVRYLLGWLLFYLFILMMYVVLPGGFKIPIGKVERHNFSKRVKSQMPGAAFTSVAWLAISRLVRLYIEIYPNLSVMYGSLAGIVIIMLWLYFCMYFLLIGAMINYFFSNGYLTRVKKMLK
ncbi:MAG: YihY/virulence factor BrkB family protein [Lachnospiraceae bacterium]|nr:YihY/virulence factor BrkB family protein [Lachnospiraceae bacterium]